MYAIRSYYVEKGPVQPVLGICRQGLFGRPFLPKSEKAYLVRYVPGGIRRGNEQGGAAIGKPLPRITSYNVCYTKLLRMTHELRQVSQTLYGRLAGRLPRVHPRRRGRGAAGNALFRRVGRRRTNASDGSDGPELV